MNEWTPSSGLCGVTRGKQASQTQDAVHMATAVAVSGVVSCSFTLLAIVLLVQ